MANETREQALERLTMERSAIQQLMATPQWQVFEKRIGYGIKTYNEILLTSFLDYDKTQAVRERVLAYRELRDLPGLIDEEIKQLESNPTEA